MEGIKTVKLKILLYALKRIIDTDPDPDPGGQNYAYPDPEPHH